MGRKSETEMVLQNQAMRVYVGHDSSELNRRVTRKSIKPEMSEDESQEEVKVLRGAKRISAKQSDSEEVLVNKPPSVTPQGKRRARQTQNDSQSYDAEVGSAKKSSTPKKPKTSESSDGEEDKESDNEEKTPDEDDNEEENTTNGNDSKDLEEPSKENYEVEKLISSRVKNGKTQYKVHWKGYSSSQDTWENESNLDCDKLIEQFLSTQKKKKTSGSMQQNGEWEVLKIVDMHIFKTGKREFLVRWKGFGPKGDTWEPEDNLKHTNLLNKYLAKLEEVKSIPLKELRVKRQKTERLTYMPQGLLRRESKRYRNKQRTRYYDD